MVLGLYLRWLRQKLKDEEAYLFEYQNLAEAQGRIGHFIEEIWDAKRLHLYRLCRGNIPLNSSLLISIITPCLNRVRFVEEAVDSMRQQDYPYVEHIVMDGGSTDGTLEVLSHYPHLRVFSQPDEGIYDALNKGLRLAHGEVIGFLNTDDLYEPDIFATVAQTFNDNSDIDALVGGASIFYEKFPGEWVTLTTFPCIFQDELLARSTEGAPIFNAWFFRKRLFDALGIFDTHYLYVADRDFLIRMAFQNPCFMSLDRPFYHYRMHRGSYTLSGLDSGEDPFMFECRALAERYLPLQGSSPSALKCFKTWHSQITTEQILTACRKKAFGRMARYMFIGLRYNHLGWLKIFVSKVMERFSALK